MSIDRGECRVVEGRDRTTVLIGHCFADDDLVRVRSGDLRALMSLPGAYSAVVVRDQQVGLASDASAQFPLYVSTSGGDVVFGSRAHAVAEQIGVRLDLGHLAAQIVYPLVPELLVSRTAFHGVRQLEPGAALRWSADGMSRMTATPLTAVADTTFDDCAEELRECLRIAVSARTSIDSKMSSDFSGGLDSTSLAFLAAPHNEAVPVVTYAQDGAPVDDDLRHAELCGRLDPRLKHHVVVGTGEHLPYQSWPSAAELPHPSYLAMGPTRLRVAAAASLGAMVHLVGEGGDLVLGAPLGYFVDLARHRDFATLWQRCSAWGRLRQRSPLALFRKSVALASTNRRQGLTGFVRQLERAHPESFVPSWEEHNITSWGVPLCDWLAPRAREALSRQLIAAAEDDDRMDACDRTTLVQLDFAGATQRAVRETGAAQGVEVHAPFLDSEVVRVCLSLPAWRRCDPTSPKPLLRKALAGVVPQAVFGRRTKGDYTVTSYQGLRRNLTALRKMLDEPVSAEIGLIEPVRVRRALERAARGLETAWAPLNQVLAVELWLRELTRGDADV
ncbi:albusnodin/ikarugamycin family macrolactam cyclase [Lentzea sp. HUAS TT2]|uniref:albusnodin/ikarugamycin family macrolactam cyclase n=1 Tax=Lentzea sp. HUAS TT2 TaxID=3447454 RepID=UPI003F723A56